MAAIAEYQRAPLVPAAADDDTDEEPASGATAGSLIAVPGEDGTSGSLTPLPGFHSLNGHEARHGQSTRRARKRRRRPPDAEPSPRPPVRPILPMWARVVVAAALLLGGGVWIGAEVQGSGAQAAGDSPRTAASGTATPQRTATSTAGAAILGPVASPPPCAAHQAGTTPELCVSQPFGDGDTVFIIHGTGFRRFTTVTVSLVGVGASPDHPVTDVEGTFNYAIDQGHRFFSGTIPPGDYKVVVSASGEHSASATFQVNPAANGGPPGPPPGQPPPP
jgi:hypothetical protein